MSDIVILMYLWYLKYKDLGPSCYYKMYKALEKIRGKSLSTMQWEEYIHDLGTFERHYKG